MIDGINSQIHLDLGGALAAFGLIFAVYQLRKPQWELVLRIRNKWQSSLFWIFGGIGLILTLMRIIFPSQILCYLPFPLNTPLTYEVLAYLFFIASPITLFYFSTTSRGLFKKSDARKFYESLIWEVSKNTDENINAVLGVLMANLNDICQFIKNSNIKDESYQLARAVLDVILSDAAVVKILTTKRLNALQYLFHTVEKYSINAREAGIGMPIIVKNLFYDKDSFLYKHLNREGLALPLNIYESIFDSPIIITNFNFFTYPALEYSAKKEFGITGVKIFIEALSRSIKTYLKSGKVPPRHINDGLKHLSEIFEDQAYIISTEERRGIDTKYALKDEWWALHLIANF